MLDEEVPASAFEEKDGATRLALALFKALDDSHVSDGVVASFKFVSEGDYKIAGRGLLGFD